MTLFEQNIKPLSQLFYIFILSLGMDIVVYCVNSGTNPYFGIEVYWTIAIAMTLVFIVFNCLLYFYTEDQNTYWRNSILSYVILCVLTSLVAFYISGLGIDDAGSYKWIFIVFSFCYILFLVIVRTIRWLVVIAQKEDKRLRGED